MTDDYTPPNLDPDKLDFSEFHPLDHRPFDRRCRSLYGGGRNHLDLLWHIKWNVPSKIKKITHCSRGLHNWQPWFSGIGHANMKYGGRQCVWCWQDMPESLPDHS